MKIRLHPDRYKRLTDGERLEILNSRLSSQNLATQYGVSLGTIYLVIRNRRIVKQPA